MAVLPVPGDGSVSALARDLFTRVDANSDGQINGSEFQSFLDGLTRSFGNPRTSGLGSEATAVSVRSYQAMTGFDFNKLNDPHHTSPKYVFGRATQDIPFGLDRASRAAGLEKVVAHLRENGYPNARTVGDDKIDFGGEIGVKDVLSSRGQWHWGSA